MINKLLAGAMLMVFSSWCNRKTSEVSWQFPINQLTVKQGFMQDENIACHDIGKL